LVINEEGNPICKTKKWRKYAIYRLEHWGLLYINGMEVGAVQPWAYINEAFVEGQRRGRHRSQSILRISDGIGGHGFASGQHRGRCQTVRKMTSPSFK